MVQQHYQIDIATRRKVIANNIRVGVASSFQYDMMHQEIYNFIEQNRLLKNLWNAIKLITSEYKDTKYALDIGCGTGNVSGKLLKLGFNVFAFDISRDMLTILTKKYSSETFSKVLHPLIGNAEKLPFKSNTFDLITIYSVLHHLPDYIMAMKEMIRVLKVGGILYIDHERCEKGKMLSEPITWIDETKLNWILHAVAIKLKRLKLSPVDHTGADYHQQLDWNKIKNVCKVNNIKILLIKTYKLHRTLLPNPLHFLRAISPMFHDTQVFIGRKEINQ